MKWKLDQPQNDRTPEDILRERRAFASNNLEAYRRKEEDTCRLLLRLVRDQKRKRALIGACKTVFLVGCLVFLLSEYLLSGLFWGSENRLAAHWAVAGVLAVILILLVLLHFLPEHRRTFLFWMYHFLPLVSLVLAITRVVIYAQYSYLPLVVLLTAQIGCSSVQALVRFTSHAAKPTAAILLSALLVLSLTVAGIGDLALGSFDRVSTAPLSRTALYELDEESGEATVDRLLLTAFDVYGVHDRNRDTYVVERELQYCGRTLSVTAIGEDAFSGAFSVFEVELSETVTRVERWAFVNSSVTRLVVKSRSLTVEDGFASTHISEIDFPAGTRTLLDFGASELKADVRLIVDASDLDWYRQSNPSLADRFEVR